MELYLIRHGEAVAENVDPARPLTEQGKIDVVRTAAQMKDTGVAIDEIWYSSKLRAKQTAEIVAQTLGIKNVVEKQGLKPNDPVNPVAKLIEQSEKNIAVAGHLPFLPKLADLLVGGSEGDEIVNMKTATVVILEQTDFGWAVKSD